MTDDATTDRHVRVVARGVVRRVRDGAEELLVAREEDPAEDEGFCYLLGGGVEFGEHSETALRREFREELGVELAQVSYLETYEDVFTYEGRTEHEVWRVYEVEIAEEWPYERDRFTAHEPELDEEIECVWKPVSALGPEKETIYPEPVLADL